MRKLLYFAALLCVLACAGVASASQINVAIVSSLANPSFETDVVSQITANAQFLNITVIKAQADPFGSTPTLTDLDAYQAVMVIGSAAFKDSVTLGQNLADYIEQGHGVIVTALTNINSGCATSSSTQLCGAFQTGDYWAIEPGPMSYGVEKTLGTVYVSGSPLLAGVSAGAAGFDGGTGSYRISGSLHTTNTTRVADWSDGTPFLVTRSFASGATEVALNFFPVSNSQQGGSEGWRVNTQGGLIMANAFAVAANYTATDESVPEPASYLIVGSGLALVGLLLRRRSGTATMRE